jgi:hypothetical protein
MVVENRAGSGGNMGSDFVARAAPDGHTLLVNGNDLATYPFIFRGIGYDPLRDLVPVATIAVAPIVLVTGPRSRLRTLRECVERARVNPEQVDYASAGVGSANHLAGQLFARQAGIKLTHIPYRGTSPSRAGRGAASPAGPDLRGAGRRGLRHEHPLPRRRAAEHARPDPWPARRGTAARPTGPGAGGHLQRPFNAQGFERLHVDGPATTTALRAEHDLWSRIAGEAGIEPQ